MSILGATLYLLGGSAIGFSIGYWIGWRKGWDAYLAFGKMILKAIEKEQVTPKEE